MSTDTYKNRDDITNGPSPTPADNIFQVSPQARYNAHRQALLDQMGEVSHAQLVLIERIASLTTFCEIEEEGARRTGAMKDERTYILKYKLLSASLVSLGLALSPRTVKARDQAKYDGHAAAILKRG
jgi:hypothetical protein